MTLLHSAYLFNFCYDFVLQFGTQVFRLRGFGVPPTAMEPITLYANLNSSCMHVINFTNPLDVPTKISIYLKGDDADHFLLLLKNLQFIQLQPRASIDVPVMFSPESMYKHQVTAIIRAENSHSNFDTTEKDSHPSFLCWEYPVIGQPQLRPYSEEVAPRIRCCVKEKIRYKLRVNLVHCLSRDAASIHPVTTAEGIQHYNRMTL